MRVKIMITKVKYFSQPFSVVLPFAYVQNDTLANPKLFLPTE